jgi:hypothetical protein
MATGCISTTTTLSHAHVPVLSSVYHRACESTGTENRDSRNCTLTKLGTRLDTQSTRSTGWRCTTWGGSRAATATKLCTRCRQSHTTPNPKSAGSYESWITIKSTAPCWTRTHVQPHFAPQRHASTTQTGSHRFPRTMGTTHDTDTSHSGRSSYWVHGRRRKVVAASCSYPFKVDWQREQLRNPGLSRWIPMASMAIRSPSIFCVAGVRGCRSKSTMYVVTGSTRRSPRWWLHSENTLVVHDSWTQPTVLDGTGDGLSNGGGGMCERGLQTPVAAET